MFGSPTILYESRKQKCKIVLDNQVGRSTKKMTITKQKKKGEIQLSILTLLVEIR
jgi:hypothetical protein